MVQKGITKENVLNYQTRWEILLALYDGKERSAYYITNRPSINLSISPVVDHLRILEEAGLVEGRDTSTSKMRRRHYKITEKGKNALYEYNKGIAEKIKVNPEMIDHMMKFLGSN